MSIARSIACCAIASFLLGATAALCAPGPVAPLDSTAAGAPPASASPAGAYWVFFADQGPGTAASTSWSAAALAARPLCDPAHQLAVARAFPPEHWARRLRTQGRAQPDAHDLAPYRPYVERVAREGRLRHASRWLNAVSLDLAAGVVERIAALPFVAAVRPVARAERAGFGPSHDREGRPLERLLWSERRPLDALARPPRAAARYDSTFYGPSWAQMHEINVPPVHTLGYRGSRVRMMMLDTGFYKAHQALAPLDLLAEYDFVFDDGETQNEPEDWAYQHHHGTACWSNAGGYAPGNLVGPAYGATFVLAKTEDALSETRVEEDHYVAALEWADSLGVEVTSASLNYLCFDDDFCYEIADKDGDTAVITVAVDIAAARGILCVNSLGNYGCSAATTLGTPADADSMIAVGAVDSANVIASFSACGPTYDGRIKPEVVARGVYNYVAGADTVDTYGPGSGTSFAAPLVGGSAAVLREAHPEWSAMEVRQALIETADRSATPDNSYGYGRINVSAALGWTPLTYPRPFSLLAPAEGATLTDYRPTFRWQASQDPDGGEPLLYELVLIQTGTSATWSVPAAGDTALVLPFALEPNQEYAWEVTAEDAAANRRFSRERFTFYFEPPASDVAAGSLRVPSPLRVRPASNPFRGPLAFRIESSASLADEAAPPRWSIYDPLGRRVAAGRARGAGTLYEGQWNGRDDDGRRLAPGVYYLQVHAGYRTARETVVLLGD